MKYYLGIDPGKSGAFALLNEAERVEVSGLFVSFDAVLMALSPFHDCIYAALEKVHAMPGQGVVSMFTFAENFGGWQGFLSGRAIPYVLVTPQKWQKSILDFLPTRTAAGCDETEQQYRTRTTANRAALKESIAQFVRRRVPGTASLITRKKDYDLADAICIALYAKRFAFPTLV